MISRVIPSFDVLATLPNSLTAGELALVRYLDSVLPKDDSFKSGDDWNTYAGWMIFAQPYLNGSRPDVIIFNPKIGIQIFEVKDWNLNNYSFDEDEKGARHFYVHTGDGSYSLKSPTKQVEYYKEKIIGQLLPQIGELIDSTTRSYGIVKTGLYFHNATTAQAHELFDGQTINYQYFPVVGHDALKPEMASRVVPDYLLKKSIYWQEAWNKEVMFWLMPPFHSAEQAQKLNLTAQQKQFSSAQKGHHRVRGVAGSGKTQVLAYRAGHLASIGKKVLVATFNITLWHYIRDMIQRSPFDFPWDRITFLHFHGFCKDILNSHGETWPVSAENDEAVFRSVVVDKVLDTINRNGVKEKYDAILIDEGQDYYLEWYKMLCHFLTDQDEVVVVCDKKQNIYGRDLEWLDKRRIGVEKFGKWIELTTVIRLPERIAKFTSQFSETFGLNQDVKIQRIERPDLFNQYKEHSIWWNVPPQSWLEKVDEAFELIKEKGTSKHVSDTVILVPNKNYGLPCVSYFKEHKKVEVTHVFEDEQEKRKHRHKKSFWMGDSRLKISTIHSFKGWEVLNVIIYIPQEAIGNVALWDRTIYTAMTRTRQNLIIINSNPRYMEFGENIAHAWEQ